MAGTFQEASAKLVIKFDGGATTITGINSSATIDELNTFLGKVDSVCSLPLKHVQKVVTSNYDIGM